MLRGVKQLTYHVIDNKCYAQVSGNYEFENRNSVAKYLEVSNNKERRKVKAAG